MNAVLRIFAWLLALALVALPVVAVVNGWIGTERWPLSRLRVQGEFKRVDTDRLRAVLLPYAQRGFFAVRLQDAQDAIEKLPWVEKAEVRKRWPDVMEVQVIEHKPFARWGKDRLLSEQGSLFPVPKDLDALSLPQLGGPDSQVQAVVSLYNESRQLFAPMGLDVDSLVMDARGSWTLQLDNGTEVIVGRNDARPRLTRFARMLPQLLDKQAQWLQRADLRYTNGFALSWGDPVVQPAPLTNLYAPAVAGAGITRKNT
ncbi:cell division protein FtsQ/DivIB [Pseudoxanthomonas dokdonensis]|uniref:Cell division protein FtsQ n=1 Tax=Pseudoxanthomonas dokdonensis TaxID=344882 RepID=A0A0R0CJ46_9GAMM|nr:cell division protein FtsQ/DivIB [Pseudoxanthomonas dokdonensis]KRG69949.1 cell division protein FtsQ [Pseudoxanthomonas dokdonensis]